MKRIVRNTKMVLFSIRPEQWTKNLIVFAGLFFGMGYKDISVVILTFKIFVIFCVISSGSYILNDIIDRKQDKHHPDKSKRPIARGDIDVRVAAVLAISTLLAGAAWSLAISPKLFGVVVVFIALHLAYDVLLKHVAIIDVFTIAFAFIIRLVGGVILTPVIGMLSGWILLCTFLLALFLGFCKRRAELAVLSENSKHHRKSLEEYDIKLLDQLIAVTASCTVLSYSMYALSRNVGGALSGFIYTIPFVIYGIFRYLYLVNMKEGGSNPEKLLLRDIPLLSSIVLYAVTAYLLIYR